MSPVAPALSPDEAWEPLPAPAWDADAARHLLRRAGWTARPEDVARAVATPLPEVVDRLFTPAPALPVPSSVQELAHLVRTNADDRAGGSETERRRRRREFQEQARGAYEDLGIAWLQHAADPRHSAWEKYVLFLQDIFVVSFQKVRNPVLLHAHQQLLRERGAGSYRELCKHVTRSPAMIVYLDLQQSRAGRPNENFAREFFELFTLGEGNYTEDDVKQAARAFTGHRQRGGAYAFARRQHDAGRKTVFGRSGAFDGDAVIDLVFEQPAASRLVPRELIRHYLTDTPLPAPWVETLAEHWRRDGHDMGRLLRRFFGSRLFFDAGHRGVLIKSPVHFHLGLVQDLGLDVAPFPRLTLGALRQMGQAFFNPPNVRGWVGGRVWINSTTLAARRQLVQWLLTPLDEDRLNADEMAALTAARARGHARVTLDDRSLEALRASAPADVLESWLERGFGAPPSPSLREAMERELAAALDDAARLRECLGALLLSPHYQLC